VNRRPTVGFHDFLNSRPILHPFRHGLVETPFTLVIDTPANLAARFADGKLDMALIPSIEYARIPDAVIVPPVCIASLGAVETVLLYGEAAIEDIETVYVDPKSRTSVAMLEILFREVYRKEVTLVVGRDDRPDDLLRDADGVLVIGDAAFAVDRNRYVVHDLGALWYAYAGRPFVHAVMVARDGARWDAAVAAIADGLTSGLAHRELIVHEETADRRERDRLYDYLTKRIRYRLDAEEIDGLRHFLTQAKKLGLAERDDLVFYPESPDA
jgi:chorismate dehydratase